LKWAVLVGADRQTKQLNLLAISRAAPLKAGRFNKMPIPGVNSLKLASQKLKQGIHPFYYLPAFIFNCQERKKGDFLT